MVAGIDFSGTSSSIRTSTAGIEQASERIASGRRINSAADDAAGASIDNRISSQVRGVSQAIRNANDGVSFLQANESGLSSVTENVQRLRELTLQAANGTLNQADRLVISAEAQELTAEINRTVETTQFNNQPLLNRSNNLELQVGSEDGGTLNVATDDFSQVLNDAGFENIGLSTAEGATNALAILARVQAGTDSASATIGAGLNRLESTINNLGLVRENASESQSRITDADFARESSELVANQIRREASIAIQAQANQQGEFVLQLLGGR